MDCLDISIPQFIREVVKTPPGVLWEPEDEEAKDMIQAFGQEFGCSGDEIAQARRLAAGRSDIIIILEKTKQRRRLFPVFRGLYR